MNATKFGKEYQRQWRINNKDKVDKYNEKRRIDSKNPESVIKRKKYLSKRKLHFQNYLLKRRHNIDLNQYNKMVVQQKGKCAICTLDPKTTNYKINQYSNNYKLVVDHDHLTGKIRGLLCPKCNRALGYLNDDLVLLQNAINYIKSSRLAC